MTHGHNDTALSETTPLVSSSHRRRPSQVATMETLLDIVPSNNSNEKEEEEDEEVPHRHHGTTRRQTILNIMKTCMGTGCLALTFACQQSGILVYSIGSILIASWNLMSVQRLVKCRQHITNQQRQQQQQSSSSSVTKKRPPPEGTSWLGQVAWYSFGNVGLQVLDSVMICLLLGIILTYTTACWSFLQDSLQAFITTTTTTTTSTDTTSTTFLSVTQMVLALLLVMALTILSVVPDLGYLTHVSALGLALLFATFGIVVLYGRLLLLGQQNENDSMETIDDTNSITNKTTYDTWPVWPSSWSGMAQWFGVVVFGFGVVPLTFNFQDSMAQPSQMVSTTGQALGYVVLIYWIMGMGLLSLYPNLTGDVLHELPTGNELPLLTTNDNDGPSSSVFLQHVLLWLPIVTRWAMTSVVVMTAPLLVVPCGELVEGKFGITHHRILVRTLICLLAVSIAILLPSGFVQVLSFVGSACVGTVSFILPPLFHLKLAIDANDNDGTIEDDSQSTTTTTITTQRRRRSSVVSVAITTPSYWLDVLLLLVGTSVTVFCTMLSLRGSS